MFGCACVWACTLGACDPEGRWAAEGQTLSKTHIQYLPAAPSLSSACAMSRTRPLASAPSRLVLLSPAESCSPCVVLLHFSLLVRDCAAACISSFHVRPARPIPACQLLCSWRGKRRAVLAGRRPLATACQAGLRRPLLVGPCAIAVDCVPWRCLEAVLRRGQRAVPCS